ncbi:MAG: response regulator transcription factor [Anaerolineae bacterium]
MNGKRLIVVEDDFMTRTMLRELLEHEGYSVSSFSDAPEALEHIRRNGLPHLAIIDLGLPTMHGFELSGKLKQLGDVPIVILTGDTSLESRIEGINRYAEDYITKPFHPQEVIARVKGVLRRMPSFDYVGTTLVIDDMLAIDFTNSHILRDNQRVNLTPIENGLLSVLVMNRGQVMSSEILIQRVWRSEDIFEDTLRVHIHRLRRKLQPDANGHQYIRNEHGLGYVFTAANDATSSG